MKASRGPRLALWRRGRGVATRNHFASAAGVRRTLSKLKSMGIKMAVLSNHHNHEALVGHLDGLGLGGFFVCVLSSSQVGFRKPDPEIFEKRLSALSIGPKEAIYVGDSVDYDVAGAKAAGMWSVLAPSDILERAGSLHAGQNRPKLPPRPATPDFAVKSLQEIPQIIRQLNVN